MTRIAPISYKKLVSVLDKEGFNYSRTKGDHLVYIKSGLNRPIIIPKYNSLPVFIIKNVLRTAGIDRNKYFSLLNKKD